MDMDSIFKTTPTLQSLGILGNNREKLFRFFCKSMVKIETALEDEIKKMTPAESEGVLANFQELNRLLAISAYGSVDESLDQTSARRFQGTLMWIKKLIKYVLYSFIRQETWSLTLPGLSLQT